MEEVGRWLIGGLILANQVLSATVVLTSFSLLLYLLTHNLRSRVARAFCALLVFVLFVYAGDVVLYAVETPLAAERWLKFQWIGIAFVPAAYLQFADAVLRTTGLRARWRGGVVVLSYAASTVCLGLVLFTDLLVYDGTFQPNAYHLSAGPFFWIFALYFIIAVTWGALTVRRARDRCLARASRRRMLYLGLASVAPALGVFPYMVVASMQSPLPENPLQLLLLVGNVLVLLMIVLMSYSVAYFGALTPDRVIRHNLVHYLLRGPVVGAIVIFTMLAVPKVQQILGMPRDTMLIFAVVGVIVLLQLALNRAKPVIDRLIYREDREEIAWIQTLDRRLLTSADLSAFLENTLAALCDLLQVRTGFVVVLAGGQYRLEAFCGDKVAIQSFLDKQDLAGLVTSLEDEDQHHHFSPGNGFWIALLHSTAGDVRLGLLSVEARTPMPALLPEEESIASLLLARAQEALEDRYLQQNVFDTLRRILPNIEQLHRWQDATRYAGSPPMQLIGSSPVNSPEFQQWVRDALSHYWGGPKLTESPLLALRIVGETAREQGGNPVQALRTVLAEAIERIRPAGERKSTDNEWMLYNILDLKFIRGLRVRDVAGRLAMSESDLYRKQRVAISEVARALADLEQDGTVARQDGERPEVAGQVKDHLDNAF
ncbi:MAG: histidine kinase N-terminal 7TM domain-containing protein [Anaerolineae bacterium]